MSSGSVRPGDGKQRITAEARRPESPHSSEVAPFRTDDACSVQPSSAPKPRKNRRFIRDGEGSNISRSKDLVTQWFAEIVSDLRKDDPMKWTNVAIGGHVGYSDVTIGQYLSGEKQLAFHTVLRMPWSIRWRLIQRATDYGDRGGM